MVTVKAIATTLGITERAVQVRASKESWPFEEQTGRGGKRRLYPVRSLPEDVRQAIAAAMLCDGSEKDAGRSLSRYLEALEAAGYLLALPRRGEDGRKRWRLRRDCITGPEAPAYNTRTRRVTDCNTGEVFAI